LHSSDSSQHEHALGAARATAAAPALSIIALSRGRWQPDSATGFALAGLSRAAFLSLMKAMPGGYRRNWGCRCARSGGGAGKLAVRSRLRAADRISVSTHLAALREYYRL
jgi:hypothetical protein